MLALLVAGDADAAERLLQKPVGQQELAVRLERPIRRGRARPGARRPRRSQSGGEGDRA
jgi:hypothetical protein